VACVTWRTRVDRNLRVLTPFAWAQHRWWCVERVCASLRIATAMEGDEMARAGAFRRGRCSPSTVAQSDARRRRRRKAAQVSARAGASAVRRQGGLQRNSFISIQLLHALFPLFPWAAAPEASARLLHGGVVVLRACAAGRTTSLDLAVVLRGAASKPSKQCHRPVRCISTHASAPTPPSPVPSTACHRGKDDDITLAMATCQVATYQPRPA